MSSKALFKATYSQFDATFDLQIPLSADYEIDIDFYEDLRRVEDFDYKKSVEACHTLKYHQGVLSIHATCHQEQSIAIKVKDAKNVYSVQASADQANKDNIKVENVELQLFGVDEEAIL